MSTPFAHGHPRLRALVALLLISGFLAFVLVGNERARSGGEEIILDTQPIDPRDIFFGNYATLSYRIERERNDYELLSSPLKNKVLVDLEKRAREESRGYYGEEQHGYALVKAGEPFHGVERVVGDMDEARRSDLPFLAVSWRPSFRQDCKTDKPQQLTHEGRCWRGDVNLRFDLPDRYYADPETAQRLETLVRASRNFERETRRFENCEKARLEASDGVPLSSDCEERTERPKAPPEFGIILSVDNKGEAVIKGVYLDGRKVYDTLSGPRITADDL